MWTRTIGFLKDHLSPDAVEKYGPLSEAAATQPVEVQGQEEGTTVGTGTTSVGETIETGEIVEGGETAVEGETAETEEIAEKGQTVETGETVEEGETIDRGDGQLGEGKEETDS